MQRHLYTTTRILFFVMFAIVSFKILTHPAIHESNPFRQEVSHSEKKFH